MARPTQMHKKAQDFKVREHPPFFSIFLFISYFLIKLKQNFIFLQSAFFSFSFLKVLALKETDLEYYMDHWHNSHIQLIKNKFRDVIISKDPKNFGLSLASFLAIFRFLKNYPEVKIFNKNIFLVTNIFFIK